MTRDQMNWVLDATVKHYNRKNRATHGVSCVYDNGTHQCAVGRLFTPDALNRFRNSRSAIDALINDYTVELVIDGKTIVATTEDGSFLRKVQGLHDTLHFWDDRGITREGRVYVARIKKEFDL